MCSLQPRQLDQADPAQPGAQQPEGPARDTGQPHQPAHTRPARQPQAEGAGQVVVSTAVFGYFVG